MRVIPLYSWPADPLASHRVIAPGGFELWQFEAGDPTQALQLKVEFALGHPSDSEYQLAYRRFLRNPTRVSPPLPEQFPFLSVTVTQREKIFGPKESRLKAEDVRSAGASLDIRF